MNLSFLKIIYCCGFELVFSTSYNKKDNISDDATRYCEVVDLLAWNLFLLGHCMFCNNFLNRSLSK